jgi:hypothetical protein
MIKVERLQELLSYDPIRGELRWKIGRPGASAGKIAGCIRPDGYITLSIDRERLLAHRVVWALVHGEWPESEIDHKNMDRGDNRIENLRLANSSQNKGNTRAFRSNASGFKGASFDRKAGKWVAQIQKDKRRHFLGHFATVEEAHAAYKEAACTLFGEFARAA